MPEHIFLSLLGAGRYVACRYRYHDAVSEPVEFIQTALAELAFHEENYTAVVVCTDGAIEANWSLLAQEFAQHKLVLPDRLKVPRGENEEQLWAIFEQLVERIPEDAQVWVDVTHAFRSLPLVIIIALQYLKVVKNVTIRGVYYGAFERLGKVQDVRKIAPEERIVPVFDLSAFITLFDWSLAAHSFLKLGHSGALTALVKQGITPVLTQTEGRDESAAALRRAVQAVDGFSESVRFLRGKEISEGSFHADIREQLEKVRSKLIPPVVPVLEKLETVFEKYNDTDSKNGLRAAEWALDHGMPQQAITLLQETVITLLVGKLPQIGTVGGEKEQRTFVAKLLNVVAQNTTEDKWEHPLKEHPDVVRAAWTCIDKRVAEAYRNLTTDRNDMNHAGFRQKPSKPARLEKRCRENCERLCALLGVEL